MLIRLRVLRGVCVGSGVNANAGDVVELDREQARPLIGSGAAELAVPDLDEEARWDIARGLREPAKMESREEGARA